MSSISHHVPLDFLICVHLLAVVLYVIVPKINQTKSWKFSFHSKHSAAVACDEDSHGIQDYTGHTGLSLVPLDVFVLGAYHGPTWQGEKLGDLAEQGCGGYSPGDSSAASFLSQQGCMGEESTPALGMHGFSIYKLGGFTGPLN